MRSWLVGFIVFGVAYAVFVIAIFAVNWPTLEHPRLHTTLESKLPETVRDLVIKVVRRSGLPGIDSNFEIREKSYELQDGSFASTIVIINGHLLILEKNTTSEAATRVAERYVKLIETHIERRSRQQRNQMLGVLFVPLGIFALFAFPARWLWNRLLKVQ